MAAPLLVPVNLRTAPSVQFIMIASRIKLAYIDEPAVSRGNGGSGIAAGVSGCGAGAELFAGGRETLPYAARREHFNSQARGVGGPATVCSWLGRADADRCRDAAGRIRRAHVEFARGDSQGGERAARTGPRPGLAWRERELDSCTASGACAVPADSFRDSWDGASGVLTRRAPRGDESPSGYRRDFLSSGGARPGSCGMLSRFARPGRLAGASPGEAARGGYR